eukprot:g5480.t1
MRAGARGAFRYARARNETSSAWARDFNRGFGSSAAFGAFSAAGSGKVNFAVGEPMPMKGFPEQHTIGNMLTCSGLTELAGTY